MCWIPTNKEHVAVAKVAQKDIPIIKIGYSFQKDKFASFVKIHEYDLQCPTSIVKIKPHSMTVYNRKFKYSTDYIEEGYHFYKSNMIRTVLSTLYLDMYINICSRFNKKSVFCFNITGRITTICIAKGYIPKGTTYYLNSNGEGVAEQITITEIKRVRDYLTNKKLSKS